ncbi:MAG TPA: hypothetical protein VN374_03375 [Desulfitobacteriaceae bacterium]|nr:hypothetical protein [Desulfitobacteriaceae bacterium]
MSKKFYSKPIRNGWIIGIIGTVSIFAGFIIAGITNDMGYYALMMAGVFLAITGLVIIAVYSKLERAVRKTFNTESPLLRFTAAEEDYQGFMEAQADEIRSINRTSRNIALFFCALIAIAGLLFIKEEGYYFTFIAAGIAVFLVVSQWLITGYRVKKLFKGDKEVILTEEGAYVCGQFHIWSRPIAFLDKVQYLRTGEYKGSSKTVIRISYSTISGTLVTPCTFVIMIPYEMEEQAEIATEKLKEAARR